MAPRQTDRSTDRRLFNIYEARIGPDGKPFIASALFPQDIPSIHGHLKATRDEATADGVREALETPLMTDNYIYHGRDFLLARRY